MDGQTHRRTDRQTDGIAAASAALAMRALRLAVKLGVVFHQVWSESQWTVSLRYLIDTLSAQQMLDAVKHVVDNSIVFQQDTAPVCNQQGLYQSITLGCAAIATSANSKLSVSQSACDVSCDYLRCGSCDVAIVWNYGFWMLTAAICK